MKLYNFMLMICHQDPLQKQWKLILSVVAHGENQHLIKRGMWLILNK